MMGLSVNVAWYLFIVAPLEMSYDFCYNSSVKKSYLEITTRIFIFPTLKQKRGWL